MSGVCRRRNFPGFVFVTTFHIPGSWRPSRFLRSFLLSLHHFSLPVAWEDDLVVQDRSLLHRSGFLEGPHDFLGEVGLPHPRIAVADLGRRGGKTRITDLC